MRARISGRAQNDLDCIYAHLYSARGTNAADEFLRRARQAVQFIAQNPHAGPHPNWATCHKTLRFWVISGTRFLIYYLPKEDGVSVERVLDGRRDVVRIMEKGIEDAPEETE
jgi:plasmid stabilization system protein ParE